jgi:hypothetical protein
LNLTWPRATLPASTQAGSTGQTFATRHVQRRTRT